MFPEFKPLTVVIAFLAMAFLCDMGSAACVNSRQTEKCLVSSFGRFEQLAVRRHEPLSRREWVNSLRTDEIEAHLGQEVTPESKLTIEQLEPLFHARANRIEFNEI